MPWSSDELATYARETTIDAVSDAVVERVEQIVTDSMGCSLGAVSSPPVMDLLAAYGTRIGADEATIFGTGSSVPVEYAALINGTMVRYLDYNDAYVSGRSVCHPSDHVPGLISVAEAEGATGADLIEAIVVAYGVECRGVDTGAAWQNGFDYVTWGSFSTAAAAGTLMGLSHDELVNAIGIAGTAGTGLLVSRLGDVSKWKGVAHSYAVHNAIQACQLARTGMTGPRRVFEGAGGFFEVVSDGPVEAPFDGPSPVMATNLKPHACGYFMQSSIEATAQLVADHDIAPESISTIHVETFEQSVQVLGDEEKWSADLNRETADHSLPYTTAVAALEGAVRPEHFGRDWLDDPRIHELMEAVEVTAAPALTRDRTEHPGTIPAIVTIETATGSYTARVDRPIGHAANPMPNAMLRRKAVALMSSSLSDAHVEQLLEVCGDLHTLESIDELVMCLAD